MSDLLLKITNRMGAALEAVLKLDEIEFGDESLLPPDHAVPLCRTALRDYKCLTFLSGMSMATLMGIRGATEDDLCVTHAGPDRCNNKYIGWITTAGGRPILNTGPNFDSPQAAEDHMKQVIKAASDITL